MPAQVSAEKLNKIISETVTNLNKRTIYKSSRSGVIVQSYEQARLDSASSMRKLIKGSTNSLLKKHYAEKSIAGRSTTTMGTYKNQYNDKAVFGEYIHQAPTSIQERPATAPMN